MHLYCRPNSASLTDFSATEHDLFFKRKRNCAVINYTERDLNAFQHVARIYGDRFLLSRTNYNFHGQK